MKERRRRGRALLLFHYLEGFEEEDGRKVFVSRGEGGGRLIS